MHPYLTGLMVEDHLDDLRREADLHRLVRQAREARPRRALPQWRGALTQVGEKVHLLTKPAPAAAVGCAPQPVCCPA